MSQTQKPPNVCVCFSIVEAESIMRIYVCCNANNRVPAGATEVTICVNLWPSSEYYLCIAFDYLFGPTHTGISLRT